VTTIKSSFALPAGVIHWMAIPADVDGDGNEEIVLTTMDQAAGPTVFSPATQAYVLGVANNKVSSMNAALFGATAPMIWSGKPTAGDFDGDGRTDLLFCDRGRNEGEQPPYGQATTRPGVWGAQTQVWLQTSPGRLTNFTDRMPQGNLMSWGCSSGDMDKSGRHSIVLVAFKDIETIRTAVLLKWDGTRFNKTLDLVSEPFEGWFWSATGDFDKDGFADITGRGKVLWGGGTGLARKKVLSTSQAEAAGYDFIRGAVVADFTGDGYPDLVRNSGLSDATLAGARFAMWESDQRGNLVEKTNAFPALSTYYLSDFGNDMSAIDVNFDGALDIVTFGAVYDFSADQRLPTAVWLNNGNGTFRFSRFSDELESFSPCQTKRSVEAYFLKTKDPKAFNLVIGGCRGGNDSYFARLVTPKYPLKVTP
jgi:hypothetical protein